MNARRLVFPAVLALSASAALVWSIDSIAASTPAPRATEPLFPPARSPSFTGLDGPWLGAVGLVEPAGEERQVGVHRSGVVTEVRVVEGQSVSAGDVLFVLDPRAREAEVALARAALQAAEAREAELAARVGPLAALVSASEARVRSARATLELAQSEDRRAVALADARALSTEEKERRSRAVEIAAANLAELEARTAEARSELALVTDGSPPGARLAAARAEVAQARAALAAAEVELELLTVRAPSDGDVLAVDLRTGEYASAGGSGSAPVVLGSKRLEVRAEFAEEDAPRFSAGARAFVSLRGAPERRAELTYLRTVPRLQPKRTLSGGASERVDTRVMEVLYALDASALPVAPGQRVDVYVAESAPAGP